MTRSDMRRWAAAGAQQRLVEIANEQRAIFAAFPELRGHRTTAGAAVADNADSDTAPRKRRRFRMSAAARKRISEAQKARWAKQKAQKK